ncbi:hypothetical protein PHMEG_00030514 [Phytophthora megakarya]|uniref:Uncharacterized protein n=1 Tax=Phytophthora megakarya TaxID=4795 RepID=A0A225V0D6_9STRA|nr:hypothetical protein PHMEG_00030514 [Phytophthora megakarya]
MTYVARVLGVSVRSIERWYNWFQSRGSVEGVRRKQRASRWPANVYYFVGEYAASYSCFYIDEFRTALEDRCPTLKTF